MNKDHRSEDGPEKSKLKPSSKLKSIVAALPTSLIISITEDGRHIPLEMLNEMKTHLLVVNEELSWFDHLHPKEQPDGTYHVVETFPAAGKYILFADYKTAGGDSEVNMHCIEVTGTITTEPLSPETKLQATVNGYTMSFLNGDDLKVKRIQGLQFSIVKDGHKLQERDLQLYRGATAHIIMISKADYDFLHLRPVSNRDFPVYGETQIEKAGLYRVWVQFKVADKILTADFTVTVIATEEC